MPHSNQIFPYNDLPAHWAFSLFLFHIVWNVLSHHFLKPCPCDVEISFCLLIPGFLPSAFTHSYSSCPQNPLHSDLGTIPLSDAEIAPVFLVWSTPTYIKRPERSDCIFSLPTFPPPLTGSLSDLIPGSSSSTLTSLLLIECCRPDYVVGPFRDWSLPRLFLLQTCT